MIDLQVNPECFVNPLNGRASEPEPDSCDTRVLKGMGTVMRCLYFTTDFNWFEKRYIVRVDALIERPVLFARNKVVPAPLENEQEVERWGDVHNDRSILLSSGIRHNIQIVSSENFPKLRCILADWIVYCNIKSSVSRYFTSRFCTYADVSKAVLWFLSSEGPFKAVVCINNCQDVLSVGLFMENLFQNRLDLFYLVSSPMHIMHRNCAMLKCGGSAILQAIEEIAREKGLSQISLHSVGSANTFYESHGFESVDNNLHFTKFLYTRSG